MKFPELKTGISCTCRNLIILQFVLFDCYKLKNCMWFAFYCFNDYFPSKCPSFSNFHFCWFLDVYEIAFLRTGCYAPGRGIKNPRPQEFYHALSTSHLRFLKFLDPSLFTEDPFTSNVNELFGVLYTYTSVSFHRRSLLKFAVSRFCREVLFRYLLA